MLVKTLDGKEYKWTLLGHNILDNRPRSDYHKIARQLILEIYNLVLVLEEVDFKPNSSTTLYLDFYIPTYKICIEVHGEQHYKFTPFFHKTKLDFLKAQKNDRVKKDWCELNGITYIELPFNEQETWKTRLTLKQA